MQYDDNAEKYGYEGEMTPIECDKLNAYKGDVTIPVYGTIADAEVYLKKEADETIAELKDKCQMHDFFWEGCGFAKRGFKNTIAVSEAFDKLEAENAELKHTIDELVVVKKSAELILQNLLDCGLIKEWYFNGKFNAVLKADDPHLKIAELKQKLENVQASMYADVVDANMENRRLKRALWLARAERALEKIAWFKLWNASISTMNPEDGARQEYDKWKKSLGKFLKKAEEYK